MMIRGSFRYKEPKVEKIRLLSYDYCYGWYIFEYNKNMFSCWRIDDFIPHQRIYFTKEEVEDFVKSPKWSVFHRAEIMNSKHYGGSPLKYPIYENMKRKLIRVMKKWLKKN